MVQVLGCNPEVGTLTINDGDHFINVMLTLECIADITKDDVISNLKHTWIKIEIYHFSTVIQCVGSRDETRFASQAITFPLTIQCAKLQPLGAHDVEDFGQPIDLNKDPDVSNRLKGLTYIELTQMLGNRQFPDHKILPNSGHYVFLCCLCFHPFIPTLFG